MVLRKSGDAPNLALKRGALGGFIGVTLAGVIDLLAFQFHAAASDEIIVVPLKILAMSIVASQIVGSLIGCGYGWLMYGEERSK